MILERELRLMTIGELRRKLNRLVDFDPELENLCIVPDEGGKHMFVDGYYHADLADPARSAQDIADYLASVRRP